MAALSSEKPQNVFTKQLTYAGAVKSSHKESSSGDEVYSIHLKGVPDNVNNESFLLEHFEKFGSVRNVECHPEKKYADVHFRTKVSV